MSVLVAEHALEWVTAAPLWSQAAGTGREPVADAQRDAMRRPALLSFASDSFMEDLAALLADDPERLRGHVAEPETFRPVAPAGEPPAPPERLKLFLPAQGRFYLVAAGLVCRRAGLPDHAVQAARGERASFVLRRLAPRTGADPQELAWVPDAATPQGGRWVAVPDAETQELADGEDVLPMFPYAYAEEDRSRRLFVGLVPTSSGESFRNAGPAALPPAQPAAGAAPYDPRGAALRNRIADPLESLQRRVRMPVDDADRPPRTAAERQAIVDVARAQNLEASRFLLVDLAERLVADQPASWDAVRQRRSGVTTLGDRLVGQQVHDRDRDPDLWTGMTWADALDAAWQQRERIWRDKDPAPTLSVNLERSQPAAATLRDWLLEGLPEAPAPPPPTAPGAEPLEPAPGPEAAEVPKLAPGGVAYRIRCVYRRPECGPLVDDVVSEPTEDFEIASFFDLDAPARPVNIGLPIDTSIADLRKFKKNVSFQLSDQLRSQVARATDLAALMKGELASGQPVNVGLVCQFSIPIITICALILLMIIVNLLNIVFRWMPYFQFCFPAGLRAR